MHQFYIVLFNVDTHEEAWVILVSLDILDPFLDINQLQLAYPTIEVAYLVPTDEMFQIISGDSIKNEQHKGYP